MLCEAEVSNAKPLCDLGIVSDNSSCKSATCAFEDQIHETVKQEVVRLAERFKQSEA